MLSSKFLKNWLSTLLLIVMSACTVSSVPSTTIPSTIKVTLTDTPYRIPTITSYPTITPKQAGEIDKFMKDNGNCILPCWWGVFPGITEWEDLTYLETLTTLPRNNVIDPALKFENSYLIFEIPTVIPEKSYIKANFTLQKNVIAAIKVSGIQTSPAYSLRSIFANNGKPDEIWLWTFSNYPVGGPPARMYFLYTDQNFLLEFVTQGEFTGKAVHTCFNYPGGLYVWEPAIEINTFEDALKYFDLAYDPINFEPRYLSLSEASGVSVDEFYSVNEDRELACIETPVELWVSPF